MPLHPGWSAQPSKNAKHYGKAYLMTCGTKSHFMTAATTQEYMDNLLTPALRLRRQELGLSAKAEAMLTCDAFSGNFADSEGQSVAREVVN